MWTYSDTPRRRRVQHSFRQAAAALLILALPLAAAAGLDKRYTATPGLGAQAKARPGGSGQQLRCWQYGRLILEENAVSAPAESAAYALRLHATDSPRTPLLLLSTGSATCLIKGSPASGKP